MNIEVVKAVATVAAPLISKEEHLAGEKVLQLAFKWGEPVAVKLVAIGWKRLRQISSLVVQKGLSHDDHVEMIVAESAVPQTSESNPTLRRTLDLLDAESIARLTTHALALSLGESAVTKKTMPATEAQPPTPGGTSSAGTQPVNSWNPDGAPQT